jgi:hypothetical protein
MGDPAAAVEAGRTELRLLAQRTGAEGLDPESFEIRSAMVRPLVFSGQGQEALTLAETNIATAQLAQQPRLEQRAFVELGEAAYALGRGDVAARVLSVLPDPRRDVARAERLRLSVANTRAKMLYIAGRFDEARETLRWALDLASAMPASPSQSTFLAVLHATASELHLSGLDPRLSWEHAERSLALQRQRATDRRLPDRGLLATLLSAADAALDLDELDSAQARLAEAEELATGDLGPGSTAYLTFLARRGRYRFLLTTRRAQERDSDDVGLAIQDLEQAAAGFRSHQIKAELPAILVHLAQALLLTHRTQEALTAANEAYAIDLDIYGPNHPETRTDLEILTFVKAVADGTRS